MIAGDFAEALFGIVEKFGGWNRFHVEAGFARFDARQSKEIFSKAGHASGILANDFKELARGCAIVGSAVEQSFRIALNRGERRAQFVGNVGDEVAAGFFDALGFGEVAEHGDGTSSRKRGSGDIESAPRDDRSGAGGLDFVGGRGFLDGGEEVWVADGFLDRLLQAGALRNEVVHGLIGPLHVAVGADGDDGVLHAVEQSFELALAGADGGKTFFDAASGLIDGAGDAAYFVLRRFENTGVEIAVGDAAGDFNDVLEAAGGPIGGDGGHYQSEEEGEHGSEF